MFTDHVIERKQRKFYGADRNDFIFKQEDTARRSLLINGLINVSGSLNESPHKNHLRRTNT